MPEGDKKPPQRKIPREGLCRLALLWMRLTDLTFDEEKMTFPAREAVKCHQRGGGVGVHIWPSSVTKKDRGLIPAFGMQILVTVAAGRTVRPGVRSPGGRER